ncbi:MAG TPA: hypothetical protein VGA65_04295 [Hyphomicrobium sp.]
MRLQVAVASLGLALTMGFAVTAPVAAGWFSRDRDPDAPDRYPYVYEAPRYYPYYNSNYWRPAQEMRRPRPYYVQPPYYPAWGYPLGCEADCQEAPLK